MRTIQLGGVKHTGFVALVDDEDYERCAQHKWHVQISRVRSHGAISAYYAQGTPSQLPKGQFLLHRFILQISDPLVKIDHRNGNGLDNRRENLRVSTCGQNLANRSKARKNTSGYKGVYRSGRKWAAMISDGGHKVRTIGRFESREDAARAYDKAAFERWGEFARLNLPVATQATAGEAAPMSETCARGVDLMTQEADGLAESACAPLGCPMPSQAD